MLTRQTNQARLKQYRMLKPGEVDFEINVDQLITPPPPIWDSRTLEACSFLFHQYIQPNSQSTIPDHAFADLPRWVFLDYLIQFRGILLVGSSNPDLVQLEPTVIARNVEGWNTPRYYAYSNSMDAIFHAILDRSRLQVLDASMKSTMARLLEEANGQPKWGFYYGIDYRALPFAPWQPGTVYIYKRADFPTDYAEASFVPDAPIRPAAKLRVMPWHWPLLDQVQGVDLVAQTERQNETFRGYPWVGDAAIHPNHWQRGLVNEAREYLKANYADSIDLARLGRTFGISAFSMLRAFRAHTGLSPRQYRTLLRVEEAKRLLRLGKAAIHVAAEVGFCDQTHLIRHFSRVVSMSPGQFQRLQESPIQSR